MKKLSILILALCLILPNLAEARGFSGGGHSFSSSHSSFSSSRSSFSSRSSYSRPSTTTKTTTTTRRSLFGRKTTTTTKTTTTKKPSVSLTKRPVTKSVAVNRPVVKRTGTVYTSRTTHVYVNHHYVSVNHYYHVGYTPSSWFHYYNGFTTGMVMSSMMHPWGGTYYVGGHYATYGSSPVSWAADAVVIISVILLITFLIIIF